MKIDTAVRHITKPGANIFLELGFPPAEARRLHGGVAQADQRNAAAKTSADGQTVLVEHRLKQAEAAEILMVSRPRVSDVMNKKAAKFTIVTLIELLCRIGKPVKMTEHADPTTEIVACLRNSVERWQWDKRSILQRNALVVEAIS